MYFSYQFQHMDTFWLKLPPVTSFRLVQLIKFRHSMNHVFVGREVCLGPEGNISGAVLNHFVREPDIYRKTLNKPARTPTRGRVK